MKPEVYAALQGVSNGGARLTILWFLTEDPRDVWSEFFADEVAQIAESGLGTCSFVAPFIPWRRRPSLLSQWPLLGRS